METLRYGAEPSQFAELHGTAPEKGTAILLHGGWWRAKHDLHQLDAMAADLTDAGWRVVNIEYRRIDGDTGGWPLTFDDVRTAIRTAAPGAPSVAIGHSAGGQLALLAGKAESLSGVVALAPITDVPRCAAEELGEGAASLFLRDDDPAASPLRQLPVGCPHLVVHGDADVRVPVAHSREYVTAARAAGDEVDYVELPDIDHFRLIDPAGEPWQHARRWLAARFG
ncbi:prolyl oligopeptidase family protein [Amycolatopsis sulphurea]|uniref:Prolyl oligopeptidase family protein n=1 Tax=Amycolatopsis sulphurea TaxID=76022 RepID=A0A2A9FHC5_9PSEU|nr:alpha/beta fold hydrolase [Amycolatopsis sulphurea]PFG49829.1 prolyl oligopeptidase family protein [Amycolatopsis sulphurea]